MLRRWRKLKLQTSDFLFRPVPDWDSAIALRNRLAANGWAGSAYWRANQAAWRVMLTYHSNALEGNTLTLLETRLVLEDGISVGGKRMVELQEAVSHGRAFNFAWQTTYNEDSIPGSYPTESWVLSVQALLLRGIWDEASGCYRTRPVRTTGSQSVFPNPVKVPALMAGMGEWLNTVAQDPHPALAAEAHLRLVSIHPFADGNGRTARLLMMGMLVYRGFPPLVVPVERPKDYLAVLEAAQTGDGTEGYYELMCELLLHTLQQIEREYTES